MSTAALSMIDSRKDIALRDTHQTLVRGGDLCRQYRLAR
jgi:hypothetical protein